MRTNFALCFLIFLQCINYEEQAALKVGRHAPSTRRSWEDGEQKKLLLHLGMLSSTYYKGSYFCCWSRPLLNFFLKKKPAIFAESNLLTSKLQPRRGTSEGEEIGCIECIRFFSILLVGQKQSYLSAYRHQQHLGLKDICRLNGKWLMSKIQKENKVWGSKKKPLWKWPQIYLRITAADMRGKQPIC